MIDRRQLSGAVAALALMAEVPTHALAWTLEEAAHLTRAPTSRRSSSIGRAMPPRSSCCPSSRRRRASRSSTRSCPTRTPARRQVLNFTAAGRSTWRSSTWSGSASSPRMAGCSRSRSSPRMPRSPIPNLNLKGFFPLLLDAFGTWGGKVYGLPFDNYSGLLFYNQCKLKEAGFDKPPATWDELINVYAPKLTDAGQERNTPSRCSRCAAKPSRPTASCACCGHSAARCSTRIQVEPDCARRARPA